MGRLSLTDELYRTSHHPDESLTYPVYLYRGALYQGPASDGPNKPEIRPGFSPCIMKPIRHATPDAVLSSARTFFVTTKMSMGRRLLQSERNAMLFVDVLRTYVAAKKFRVHDFVVMPDHVHLLVTVDRNTTIERAVQFVKGGFSYRLKKETGYAGEVWRRGFSETRAESRESFEKHREYIRQNPVKAGLVVSAEDYPYSFIYLTRKKQQGLKPGDESHHPARLKPCPDTRLVRLVQTEGMRGSPDPTLPHLPSTDKCGPPECFLL